MSGESKGIIGLLTDFGLEDDYVGQVHMVIVRKNPEIKVIDWYHNVKPGSIETAAFILQTAISHFPESGVICAIVDPGVGSDRDILICKWKTLTILAPDNGLLYPLLKSSTDWTLSALDRSSWNQGRKYSTSSSFHPEQMTRC